MRTLQEEDKHHHPKGVWNFWQKESSAVCSQASSRYEPQTVDDAKNRVLKGFLLQDTSQSEEEDQLQLLGSLGKNCSVSAAYGDCHPGAQTPYTDAAHAQNGHTSSPHSRS
jgi:hypothetical protein